MQRIEKEIETQGNGIQRILRRIVHFPRVTIQFSHKYQKNQCPIGKIKM